MEFTVCLKCKHHIAEEDNDIWYNHFCGVNPAEKWRDPIDGEIKPRWGRHIYQFCRDINDGRCPFFEKAG